MITLMLLIQLSYADTLEIGDRVIVTSGFYNKCVGTLVEHVNDSLFKVQDCYKNQKYQNVKYYIVDRSIIRRLTR